MTTAALNDNLDSQVNQTCAIAALKDEIDYRNEEMGDAERSEREAIRKPRVPTSTYAFSNAMFPAGAVSAADSCGAVPSSTTGSTPRSGSAPNVVSSDALVSAGVISDCHAGHFIRRLCATATCCS